MIQDGRVAVNGIVVTEMGIVVDPDKDIVEVNGKKINPPDKKIYVMLHKPKGYITSAKDQFGRPDVATLVSTIPARLFPVGRLDYDTSGLLLMTNDGDLTYKLTHPKHEVDKVYVARVIGKPEEADLIKLRAGVEIEGQITAPAKVHLVKDWGTTASLRITIREGRNRQVRKMLAAVGLTVLTLKRVATGGLFLGDLEVGKYRFLTKDEVEKLMNI